MKWVKKFLKYVILIIVFFVLGNAMIVGNVSPFLYSFLYAWALVFNVGILDIIFALVGMLVSNITIWSIVMSTIAIVLILGLKLLTRVVKQKFWWCLYALGLFITQIPSLIIYPSAKIEILYYSITLVLSLVSFYLFYRLNIAIKYRGLKSNFVLDEKVSIFVFTLAMFLGLNRIDYFNLGLDRLILSNSLLFLTKIENPLFALLVTLGAGCGRIAMKESYGYLLNYLIWCLSLVGARKNKNIVRVIVLLTVDLLLGAVLQVVGVYTIWDIVSALLGAVIYLVFPKKTKFRVYDILQYSNIDQMELANFSKKELGSRLSNLSNLFNSINRVYKDMVIPTEKLEKSIGAMSDEVLGNICKNCVNYKVCYNNDSAKKSLSDLVNLAVIKGSITHINLPRNFNGCISRSALVNRINEEAKRFKELKHNISDQNNSKVSIGNQFASVSSALEVFNKCVVTEVRACREREEDFINYLMYEFIECKDCCIIMEENNQIKKVLLMLKLGVNKDKFLKASAKYFKQKLIIETNRYASSSGWQVVELKPAPKYSFLYSTETIGCNGAVKNGDNHSCSQIFGGKYLISIADGKGHGSEAYKTSKRTLELIEQYFKAGIDTSTVISSVNQILSFNCSENFSAMDICLFDPYDGVANFIKLGSTPTVIKRGNSAKVLISNALPIGACEFINCKIESEKLIGGDMVVLSSDGVFDAFGDENAFAGYINNINVSNVEIFAKNIIDEAIRRSGGKVLDDLTVVAFKVF